MALIVLVIENMRLLFSINTGVRNSIDNQNNGIKVLMKVHDKKCADIKAIVAGTLIVTSKL